MLAQLFWDIQVGRPWCDSCRFIKNLGCEIKSLTLQIHSRRVLVLKWRVSRHDFLSNHTLKGTESSRVWNKKNLLTTWPTCGLVVLSLSWVHHGHVQISWHRLQDGLCCPSPKMNYPETVHFLFQ